MSPFHRVEDLRFTDSTLVVKIDGEEHRFDLHEISDALANASAEERESFEVSPSGYGIHWPLLDEDLSIDGLLGVVHHPGQTSQHQSQR